MTMSTTMSTMMMARMTTTLAHLYVHVIVSTSFIIIFIVVFLFIFRNRIANIIPSMLCVLYSIVNIKFCIIILVSFLSKMRCLNFILKLLLIVCSGGNDILVMIQTPAIINHIVLSQRNNTSVVSKLRTYTCVLKKLCTLIFQKDKRF